MHHQQASVTGRPADAERLGAEVDATTGPGRSAPVSGFVPASSPGVGRRPAADRPAARHSQRRPGDSRRAHRAALARPPTRLPPLGWQPSRFLVDWAGAERAFALAGQLGSVNAAAQELDHLAVAAQSLYPERPRPAGPQPRGGLAAGRGRLSAHGCRPSRPWTGEGGDQPLAPCRPESA
jgi:hypothetical protein